MMRRVVWVVAFGLLAIAGCKSKGGDGAKCSKPTDCEFGARCENSRCIKGVETSCNYMKRCLPKMQNSDKETLFGEAFRGLSTRLASGKVSAAECDGHMKKVKMTNRYVVMTRACGPWIDKE